MNAADIEDLLELIGFIGGQRDIAFAREIDKSFYAQRTVEMNV